MPAPKSKVTTNCKIACSRAPAWRSFMPWIYQEANRNPQPAPTRSIAVALAAHAVTIAASMAIVATSQS